MGPAGGLGGWGSPAAHTWPHVAGCAQHWFPWAETLAKLLPAPESLGQRCVVIIHKAEASLRPALHHHPGHRQGQLIRVS